MSSEFVNQVFLSGFPSEPGGGGYPYSYAIQRASALYRSVRVSASLGKLRSLIFHKDNRLLVLPELGDISNLHSSGVKPVHIKEICGSEGRCRDFDAHFRPIGSHIKERWIRIATLIILGVYLPAVDLFKVSDRYYVRDGNHRVSVMKAMGVHYIDSHVVEIAARNSLGSE